MDVFERLSGIEFFSRSAVSIPDALTESCIEEQSWPRIYTVLMSDSGRNWLMEAQNSLTVWLSKNARDRFREWNQIVGDAQPKIAEILERGIQPRFPSGQWNPWISQFYSRVLLGIVMAQHYGEFGRRDAPVGPYMKLLEVFEAGLLPVGWHSEGSWPEGKFIVGRVSDESIDFEQADLSAEEIIAEGERLERPCWVLSSKRKGPVVANWFGADSSPGWITVDFARFESLEHIGVQTIESDDSGALQVVTSQEFREGEGIPLYAHPVRTIPPLFVIEQESDLYQRWIASDDPECDQKIQSYQEAYNSRCQLHGDDLFAIVGGWPIELYEGDWAGKYHIESQLMLTTMDAEPYVELVRSCKDGQLSARGIIS